MLFNQIQRHERVKLPNICCRCAHRPPAHSVEVEGRDLEWRYFVPGVILLPVIAVAFELYRNTLASIVLAGLLFLVVRVTIHKLRVPLCAICYDRRGLFRRLMLSFAVMIGAVSGYVVYNQAGNFLPPGPDQPLYVMYLTLFLGIVLAVVTWFFLCSIQLLTDPQSQPATFDKKSKRFFFRNQYYQNAFVELNQRGYYEPSHQPWYKE